ncbi:hypothetical protein ANCDUO_17229 [Ancylostoma duodenale]|uniref:Uncharacterized protein n=1 Tax=Ancylostoma duodenale TaxID=51022 RepID=A0A0C2CS93_9BILA|nr:hypothetical protein ANCDUO_17229 [Ancylostoma duodenale]
MMTTGKKTKKGKSSRCPPNGHPPNNHSPRGNYPAQGGQPSQGNYPYQGNSPVPASYPPGSNSYLSGDDYFDFDMKKCVRSLDYLTSKEKIDNAKRGRGQILDELHVNVIQKRGWDRRIGKIVDCELLKKPIWLCVGMGATIDRAASADTMADGRASDDLKQIRSKASIATLKTICSFEKDEYATRCAAWKDAGYCETNQATRGPAYSIGKKYETSADGTRVVFEE